MPLITLDNISLRFSEKVILDEINATIHKGDKIGLIGRNGEGKSTFLKLLAGIVIADDGDLKIKNSTRISYLEQQPPEDNSNTLFNIVAHGLGDKGKLISKYHDALKDGNISESSRLQEKIESQDLWPYLHKIETILNRFKLSADSSLSTLSGGWKRRVMLAKAIVQEPDILLLDEPTNHLDALSNTGSPALKPASSMACAASPVSQTGDRHGWQYPRSPSKTRSLSMASRAVT